MHEATGAREPHAPPGVLHWLRDASLALPVIALAVYLGISRVSRLLERFGQRLSRASASGLVAISVAVYASVAMAVGSPLHGLLFAPEQSSTSCPWLATCCATGCGRLSPTWRLSSTRPPSTSYPRRRKRSSCPTGPWSSR